MAFKPTNIPIGITEDHEELYNFLVKMSTKKGLALSSYCRMILIDSMEAIKSEEKKTTKELRENFK